MLKQDTTSKFTNRTTPSALSNSAFHVFQIRRGHAFDTGSSMYRPASLCWLGVNVFMYFCFVLFFRVERVCVYVYLSACVTMHACDYQCATVGCKYSMCAYVCVQSCINQCLSKAFLLTGCPSFTTRKSYG